MRGMTTTSVRVKLPTHLRRLAGVAGEVTLEVAEPATQRSVLDALEARHPALRGTIRQHGTLQRRAFVRFFACEEDLSHTSPDEPEPLTTGWEIKARLDHAVDAVLDSGECGTVPTTVVDFSEGEPEIVRRGAGDPSRFE